MLSDRITHIRKLRKITEKELSSAIGMSMTGFRQAMSNDDFKLSTLLNIAKILNVDITYFIKEESTDLIQENKLVNDKSIYIGFCEKCNQKDEFIKQKDEIISDLKYMIDNLKQSLTQKDKIIESLEK